MKKYKLEHSNFYVEHPTKVILNKENHKWNLVEFLRSQTRRYFHEFGVLKRNNKNYAFLFLFKVKCELV
jgi:hypothetical protein